MTIREAQKIIREFGKTIVVVSRATIVLFPSLYKPESLLPYPKKTIKRAIKIALPFCSDKDRQLIEGSRTFLDYFVDDREAYLANKKILDKEEFWEALKKRKRKGKNNGHL